MFCFRSSNVNFAPERSIYWDRSYSPDNALAGVLFRVELFEHLQQQDSTPSDDSDVEHYVVEFCGKATTDPARG
jgi:hypothetical protein